VVALATFLLLDIDGDGLSNFDEFRLGTSINSSDTDSDGLSDGLEVNTFKTDPSVVDTDNDNLGDGLEVNTYGTSPSDADTDDDGLNDGPEVGVYGTNPLKADTDNDNLGDGLEVNTHGTDPLSADTDNDNLNDWSEINTYGSNPKSADTDNDGLSDFFELNVHATDPLSDDSDNDRLLDGQEVNGWTITLNGSSVGVTSDPLSADSDVDNLSDWAEYNTYLSDPKSQDTDSDGSSDLLEVLYNTDLSDVSSVPQQIEGAPSYPRLFLEIDYMSGYDPASGAISYVESYFENDLGVVVEVTYDEVTDSELSAAGVSPDSISTQELATIESNFHDNPTTHLYVFYASELSEEGESGGLARSDFGVALNAQYLPGRVDRERTILLHEIGHAITSVGEEHCDNSMCAMQPVVIFEDPVYCDSCWGKRNLLDIFSVDEPWS